MPCLKIEEENEEEEIESSFDKTYSDDDWDDFKSLGSCSSPSDNDEYISPRSCQSSRRNSVVNINKDSKPEIQNTELIGTSNDVEQQIDKTSFVEQFNRLPRDETFLFDKKESKIEVLVSVESADEKNTFSLKSFESESSESERKVLKNNEEPIESLRSVEATASQNEDDFVSSRNSKISPPFSSMNATEPTPTTIIRVGSGSASCYIASPILSASNIHHRSGSAKSRPDSMAESTNIKGVPDNLKQALECVASREDSFNASLEDKIASMPEIATRKITPKRLTMSDYMDRYYIIAARL